MSVNSEPTRVSHAFVEKNMVRYMRPHGQFAHHQLPVLASCFEIYYFGACKVCVKIITSVLKKVCYKYAKKVYEKLTTSVS